MDGRRQRLVYNGWHEGTLFGQGDRYYVQILVWEICSYIVFTHKPPPHLIANPVVCVIHKRS